MQRSGEGSNCSIFEGHPKLTNYSSVVVSSVIKVEITIQ